MIQMGEPVYTRSKKKPPKEAMCQCVERWGMERCPNPASVELLSESPAKVWACEGCAAKLLEWRLP